MQEFLITKIIGRQSGPARGHPENIISRSKRDRFKACIKRRALHEPIHYILGRKKFWSMEFKVTPNVLIPRRETEVLIKHFLDLCLNRFKSLRVIDLCTGSGVIAVVIAKENPKCKVFGIDISAQALKVAEQNAKAHGVSRRIYFLKSDLFKNIGLEKKGSFDFILSNPPYINPKLFQYLAPEMTRYEPEEAINGGEDGLKFYRSIIPEAIYFLKPEGYLILEIGFGVCKEVTKIFYKTGMFEEIKAIRDSKGILRVISAKKVLRGKEK